MQLMKVSHPSPKKGLKCQQLWLVHLSSGLLEQRVPHTLQRGILQATELHRCHDCLANHGK